MDDQVSDKSFSANDDSDKDYSRHYYAPVVRVEYENTIFDDYEKRIIGRGFLATSSDREQYEFLKVMDRQTGGNKATVFLEELFSYGLERKHSTDDPFIRTLMIPICDRIDSDYIRYCKRCGYKKKYIEEYEEKCDSLARDAVRQAEYERERRKREEEKLKESGIDPELACIGRQSLEDLL